MLKKEIQDFIFEQNTKIVISMLVGKTIRQLPSAHGNCYADG